MKKLKPLQFNQNMVFGCDPEFFFKNGRGVVEAEKVVPKDGLTSGDNKVIIDGVQAELNPHPSSCRESLASNIANCFRTLSKKLEEKGVEVDFSGGRKISASKMKSLSKEAKEFGCAPSKNTYGDEKSEIRIDPNKYSYRSAGGHIHITPALGYASWDLSQPTPEEKVTQSIAKPEELTKVLDILLGNTCVLIDRDEGNIERRKVYGKAGEHRTPTHNTYGEEVAGLEYRVLSNFWLRNYTLFSMVFGFARLAVLLHSQSTKDNDYTKKLFSLVDMKDVEKAINKNDFDLALKNYKKIKSFLLEITGDNGLMPIDKNTIDAFELFVKKGLDFWFKGDPFEHWVTLNTPENRRIGWEKFLTREVAMVAVKSYNKNKRWK